jgi:hypothetical protein
MHDKVVLRTRIFVPIISDCDSANLQNKSVIMTFEEGTWFLDVTQRCHVITICAKLLQNPSMNEKCYRLDMIVVYVGTHGWTDGHEP